MTSEICICAAIVTLDGTIIRGHRHDDCIQTAIKMNKKLRDSIVSQGFITSTNRYVTRSEGSKLQRAAGIMSVVNGKPVHDVLFSEDLY